MANFTDVTSPIKLEDHNKRHEKEGADEMNLTGLKGSPQAIDDIMTYYGTVVTYEGKVVTRST